MENSKHFKEDGRKELWTYGTTQAVVHNEVDKSVMDQSIESMLSKARLSRKVTDKTGEEHIRDLDDNNDRRFRESLKNVKADGRDRMLQLKEREIDRQLREKKDTEQRLKEEELLDKEIEYYEEKLLRRRAQDEQEALERRLRNDIETNLRKEYEQKLKNELKEIARRESEERKYFEREKERKQLKEKERLMMMKREKQREEEMKMMERIESLKKIELEIDMRNNEFEGEDSDNDIDRDVQERMELLRQEMMSLEERIHMKSRDCRNKGTLFKDRNTTRKPCVSSGTPQIPHFDGTQFEEWKLEVESAIESGLYQDYVLAQAVRSSVVSTARRVLQTLRPAATTKEIVSKMEDIYGNIRSGDSIIHEFYSAKQQISESCSEWGVRIETLFNQALERGEIERSRKDRKLKERFWRGLKSEKIKLSTRTSYESEDSFDILRRKARIRGEERK
ncbi:trichohyalin-like [Ruditapes philippinarum]|uniref:trichohyalin-like n=1 Tax=Ruditapes philippinarum TaxID=129788 RepID=UPI00295AEF19|nr:trichohyalin-like [Ruditapes philippinarum]